MAPQVHLRGAPAVQDTTAALSLIEARARYALVPYYKLKCFFALTLLASMNLAEEFFSNYILQVKTVKPPDIMNDISGR